MENNTKIKKRLLYLFFTILLLPLAEQNLQFITSGKLNGGFADAKDTVFSFQNWMDGSFQRKKEQFLNDKTGFRPDLVRLNNQIDFSLFDKCHSGWTLLGKNHDLFQLPYINAYYGNDFCGYQSILDKSIKLKAIQDTLSRLNKSLILVFAPNKAASYPEDIPNDRLQKKTSMTNVEAYTHLADSLGINYVNMDAWFASIKKTSREPLFSKEGIHWTNYGAILAGDSLVRYVEKLRNIQVPHPTWSEINHTDKPREADDDVAKELNLIFPETKEILAYPVVKSAPDSNRKKFNAIYIGDSYGHKMVEFGIVHKMNDQCEYWFYFNEVHEINNNFKFSYIKDYDWHGAIKKTDCVILVYTLYNLWQFGNGFIDQAYDYYYPKGIKAK